MVVNLLDRSKLWTQKACARRKFESIKNGYFTSSKYTQSLVSKHKRPERLSGIKKVKGKAIPLQASTGPERFQEVEAPRFQDNRHMKVVRLSALCTGRLYPPGNIPGIHFC